MLHSRIPAISFFTVFFICACGFCETTYTYLVYKSSFTSLALSSFRDSGYGYTKFNAKVPLHISREIQPANTNYFLIKVTPTKQEQVDGLKNSEIQGKILLLQKSTYVQEYDSIRGGVVKRVDVESVNFPPEDIRRDWSKPYETLEQLRNR